MAETPRRPVVLLVDDHDDTREAFARFLEQAGLHAVTASTAEEALELFVQVSPDVLVLDICLPGMNGLQMLDRIRHHPLRARMAVLVLTAHDLAGIPEGAARLLSKPIRPDELLSEIRQVLG